MAIFNVTIWRHGGQPEVHGIEADSVQTGRTIGVEGSDTILRFFDTEGDEVAAFYDWEWWSKSGSNKSRGE